MIIDLTGTTVVTTLMYLENNEHMTSCATMIVFSLVTILIPIDQ